MVMLAQIIPFSIYGIIPIVIQILFSTITAWLSAQLVIGGARLQNALIYALITYFVVYLVVLVPIPAIPVINTIVLVEALLKIFVAMKFFNTDFRGGLSIAGVQILLGTIISIPFYF
ncbi:MAG: hypothetical protein GTN40_04140 [Candidatus Aenigmarchaeota archaeon]|nr:hypothetical protein [Candidatus Aenigmarchaeota archaeon]